MDLASWALLTELSEMIRALRRDRNPLEGHDCATHAWFLCKDRAGSAESLSLVMTDERRMTGFCFFVVPAQAGTHNPWRQSTWDRSLQSGLSSSISPVTSLSCTLSIFDNVYSFIAQRLHNQFNVFGHSQR
jgi:hypothetical protein